jgi:Fimbrial assembly protein (PilN)
MKITAHFPASRPQLTWLVVTAPWLAALAFVVVAAWLLASARDMRAEVPRLEARLARVEQQLAAARPHQALPAAADLESMRRRVSSLNKVSGVRGWATPQLLGWLGEQLPDNVYLVSLHHRPREGEAQLVAESHSAEALTGFLLRLEKEPRFSEVLLSRQGAHRAAGAPGAAAIQFEIRLRWKS